MPASASPDLDGREFVSTQVDGHDLVADSTIRISFEDGSLSINAGCNTMFGAYTVERRRAERADDGDDTDGVRPRTDGPGHVALRDVLGLSDAHPRGRRH